MKSIDIKEHTSKYTEFARKAGRGEFPNKKTAKNGSVIGMMISAILLIAGCYGLIRGEVIGWGSLIAGLIAGASNIFNLRRMKNSR